MNRVSRFGRETNRFSPGRQRREGLFRLIIGLYRIGSGRETSRSPRVTDGTRFRQKGLWPVSKKNRPVAVAERTVAISARG